MLATAIDAVHKECVTLYVVTVRIPSREDANKQVISSQADPLIKISRIWADYISHQQLESAYLGRFFAISGVISGFY